VEAETLFVEQYGMGSDFWMLHSAQDFPDVLQVLQSSLQELAYVYHEQAQQTGNADDYRAAEQYYRDYLAAFGDEAGAADMNFRLAELLYASGDYLQAIDEYERTAWLYADHVHAADAALGALQAGEKVRQHSAAAAGNSAVAERAIAGARRFAMTWPEHPAAPGVLAQAGTVLLEQQQYREVLRVSEQVLAAAAPPALRQAAWSMLAQADYGLEDYPAAATAYRNALQLASRNDPRRPALQEGLALATYKQAEQTLMRGDSRTAVTLYQQAAQLAPGSSIGSKAQYDAATALLAEAAWTQAIRMLEQFRRDYPEDSLQSEAGRKLAYAYDRSGQDSQAAAEYLRLGEDQRQPVAVQREALRRAADLFAQAGTVRQAISTCELYLERFPEPAAAAVEVMQQLAGLEANSGNDSRRQHWLEEIIRLDRAAGTAGTRVAAAEAALGMAENRLDGFHRVQLVNPVQENLARKLQAMQQALRAFEVAIEYGVTPVTTAATYQIAGMYDGLGLALLESERPASLTAGELEEYNLLLAEQAAAFAQQAIEIYTTNAQRSANDPRDPWVEKSVQRLVELQAGR
jgi:tetratricopeptide (TPR) repeat protein